MLRTLRSMILVSATLGTHGFISDSLPQLPLSKLSVARGERSVGKLASPIDRKPNSIVVKQVTSALSVVGVIVLCRKIFPSATLPVIGGLLSSSCCLIQLFLNLFPVGCAGFSVLDRHKPLFLALTFGSLSARAAFERIHGIRSPRPISWAAAVVLSFLPDIVRLGNRFSVRATRPSETIIVTRHVVQGVKCEACAQRLRTTLRSAFESHESTQGRQTIESTVDWISPQETLITCTANVMDQQNSPYESMNKAIEEEALRAVESSCATLNYGHRRVES